MKLAVARDYNYNCDCSCDYNCIYFHFYQKLLTLSASLTQLTPTSIAKISLKINYATLPRLRYYSKLPTCEHGHFIRRKFTKKFLKICRNNEHVIGCFYCYCCCCGVNNGSRGCVDWWFPAGTKHQLTAFAFQSDSRSREEPRILAPNP